MTQRNRDTWSDMWRRWNTDTLGTVQCTRYAWDSTCTWCGITDWSEMGWISKSFQNSLDEMSTGNFLSAPSMNVIQCKANFGHKNETRLFLHSHSISRWSMDSHELDHEHFHLPKIAITTKEAHSWNPPQRERLDRIDWMIDCSNEEEEEDEE